MKSVYINTFILFFLISCSASSEKEKIDTVIKDTILDNKVYKTCIITDDLVNFRATCIDFSQTNYTSEEIRKSCLNLNALGIKAVPSHLDCAKELNQITTNGHCEVNDKNGQKLKKRYFKKSDNILFAKETCELEKGLFVLDSPKI